MKLEAQKNILAIVQNVILYTILTLVELNNYLTMGRLVCLGGSLLIMAASFYPLFDLINSFGDVEHKVSTLTVGLILIWLVIALIFGMLLFYFTWQDIIDEEEEKYDQLHFKGAVYTVPEIYQESKLKFVQAYIAVRVCIKSQMGTKQLPVTLLNSVITLENDYFQVKKRKNVRQQETMEWFKYNQ